MAFDLPTQMGLDSDDALAAAKSARSAWPSTRSTTCAGCSISIPLDEVSTSMTINATAAILLLMYQLVAEEQGVPVDRIRGTVQNDILKEYAARGTYIYPPKPSTAARHRLFAYAGAELPECNTISISGYHIREAGSTAAQEIAFTIANGLSYVRAAVAAVSTSMRSPRACRSSSTPQPFLRRDRQVPGGTRALGRSDEGSLRGAVDPRSVAMRFHTQTAGSTLTAQQPENNVVRTTSGHGGGPGRDASRCTPTPSTKRSALPTEASAATRSADATDPRL